MKLDTSRFGQVEVDERKILDFEEGLIGFSRFKRYILIEQDEANPFFWLQSAENPELDFLVTDPSLLIPDYQVKIPEYCARDIGLNSRNEALFLAIVNKHGESLSANLQGPLVVNETNYKGIQLVLRDDRYSTRQEIGGMPQRRTFPLGPRLN